MGPGDVAVSFDAGPTLTQPQHRRAPLPNSLRPVIPQPPPRGMPTAVPRGMGMSSGGMGGPPAMPSGDMGGPGGPGLGFMSFPLGESGAGTTFAPPPRMPGNSFGSTAFEDEPPLLTELGINIPQIFQKMLSILNPIRVNADLHEESDLSGPLMFCVFFGLCQLLHGKVQLGIILGWSCAASLSLYLSLLLLAGGSGVDLHRCCSVAGYSLLPVALFSALSLLLPKGPILLGLGALTVLWCTRTSSLLLVHILPHVYHHRFLLAFPCALIYTAFTLLVLF